MNEDILARTRLRAAGAAADPSLLEQRLGELDREWDIERVLFTASSINFLIGLGLGAFVKRGWLGYSALVAAFQLQHGLSGWCPPLALFRRWHVRTRREIERERAALKAVRGDFDGLAGGRVDRALAVARG